MKKFTKSIYRRIFKNFLTKRSKELVLLEPHLGLGDGLISIGLVRALSARHCNMKFYYACLASHYHSLTWAFQDLPNVYPTVVRNGLEARHLANFLNISYWPIGIDEVDIGRFDESFYRQHKVPFSDRWRLAITKPGPLSNELLDLLNPGGEPYILVCDSGSHGLTHVLEIKNPSNLKYIKVHPATQNIFDWTKVVEEAQEIHTIDTSFIHFVENTLSPDTTKPLFFHRARSTATEFTRRLPWTEVSYNSGV